MFLVLQDGQDFASGSQIAASDANIFHASLLRIALYHRKAKIGLLPIFVQHQKFTRTRVCQLFCTQAIASTTDLDPEYERIYLKNLFDVLFKQGDTPINVTDIQNQVCTLFLRRKESSCGDQHTLYD
jgi:hypothetical protein